MTVEDSARREAGRLASEIAHNFKVTVHAMLRTGREGNALTARARLCETLAAKGWSADRIDRHFGMPWGWAKDGIEFAKRIPVLERLQTEESDHAPLDSPKPKPVSGKWTRIVARAMVAEATPTFGAKVAEAPVRHQAPPPRAEKLSCQHPRIGLRGLKGAICGTIAFRKDAAGTPACTYHLALESRRSVQGVGR